MTHYVFSTTMMTRKCCRERTSMGAQSNKLYIGVDLGGTFVKIGIVDQTGRILHKFGYPVNLDDYRTSILTTAIESVRTVFESNEFKFIVGDHKIEGIGVSATGQIDSDTGIVIGAAGHIPGYQGSHIKDRMQEAFHVKVTVANDADCSLLGECGHGAAKGCQNVVMMTLGTGVGGGILVDGHLLKGVRGTAGEIGHIIINDDGEKCSCGNRGCLEYYASVKALVHTVKTATKEGRLELSLFAVPGGNRSVIYDVDGLNAKVIFDCLRSYKDKTDIKIEELRGIVDRWDNHIADGLVSLVHIFNPELILIGGGVSEAGEIFIDPIRSKVLSRVMPSFAQRLRISTATLGNDSGIIGAVDYYKTRN